MNQSLSGEETQELLAEPSLLHEPAIELFLERGLPSDGLGLVSPFKLLLDFEDGQLNQIATENELGRIEELIGAEASALIRSSLELARTNPKRIGALIDAPPCSE